MVIHGIVHHHVRTYTQTTFFKSVHGGIVPGGDAALQLNGEVIILSHFQPNTKTPLGCLICNLMVNVYVLANFVLC